MPHRQEGEGVGMDERSQAEGSDQVACRFCGGAVKTAAVLCKHCGRRLDREHSEALASAEALGAEPPPILSDLRAFLVARTLVAAESFDRALEETPATDAAVAVGVLGAAGLVAPAQVDTVRENFVEAQVARVRSLLDEAVRKGLLNKTQRQAASQDFYRHALRKTPGEFVVEAGLLTEPQVRDLGRPGLASLVNAVGNGEGFAKLRSYPRARLAIIIGAALVLGTPTFCCGTAYLFGPSRIAHDGTMNGNGQGSMTFSNRGWTADSLCGVVVVECDGGTRRSSRFCSGNVEPGEALNVSFMVAGMHEITPRFRSWTENCDWRFAAER
jgi:hypothetical protein